ncbi:bacillithiol biosynthesis cysteine-adding enzyme BshC [Candidatus Bipolaricaulota bacterium]
MTQTIDPRILYSQSPFFLDYIEGKESATDFFQNSISSIRRLAEARKEVPNEQTRSDVCDALLKYNRTLDAPSGTLANIERLRSSTTLCVIGGQQAGFLGGPLFVIHKIASIIRTASWLSAHLDIAVVPIFWLASEDHDFDEINNTRWLDDSGALRTIAFDWDERGRPIEHLPISESVRDAFSEACQKISFANPTDAAIFTPTEDDSYCTWHARMWSRLFADSGLIIVEPRVLRPAAKPLFAQALIEAADIGAALAQSASLLKAQGYTAPLDPATSGRLFHFDNNGVRQRIHDFSDAVHALDSIEFSADAALRPILADSLLPSIANILGPSELAYHAMLRPLYERWEIPQPLAVPRHGATLITEAGFNLLADLGIEISDALRPEFKPADLAKRLASEELTSRFSDAHERLEEALMPLRDHLSLLDPGLETRWRQTVDQARHQVDRLEERAIRAELARRGISVKKVQNLKPLLRPMDKPQERILSAFSFIAKYGVEWVHEMIARGEPDRFEHQLVVLKESND